MPALRIPIKDYMLAVATSSSIGYYELCVYRVGGSFPVSALTEAASALAGLPVCHSNTFVFSSSLWSHLSFPGCVH